MHSGGSFYAEKNALVKARQSEKTNREVIASLNLVNALKYSNISNNFGISKTQDSKNHSNLSHHNNTMISYPSKDNRENPATQQQQHNTSSILNELTMIEYMRNHSNENIHES